MITFRRLGRLGRFGNQLFQYAGTRLYAQINGYEWGFPPWDGERVFELPQRRATLGTMASPTVQLSDFTSTGWSERLLTPLGLWSRSTMLELYKNPHDNVNLYGYLQDASSLQKLHENKDKICNNWFRFKPEIDEAFRKATDQYRPWLAVHIRLGDLVKRGAATDAQVALSHATRLRGQRNLFVATDDAALRKQLAGESTISPSNPLPNLPPFAFDFWMLANSDVLIGSGSTFAWWAAFLGGMEYFSPPLNNTWGKHGAPPITQQFI